MFYVGIDLGTYLCRFVLAKKNEKNDFLNFQIVDYSTHIINFGQVEPGVELSIRALKRLDNAFESFKKLIPEKVKIRCVATAALRFYEKSDEIVTFIKKKHNIDIEVIEPSEEIRLTAIACKKLIKDRAIVIDVGSGSTEVALVQNINGQIKVLESAFLELGLINNLTKGPRRSAEFKKLDILKQYSKEVPIICAKCNTLKIIYLYTQPNAYEKVNGVVMQMNIIKKILSKFCKMKMEDLEKIELIGAYRSNLMKLGLPWIYKVLEYLGANEVMLCEYGLKEGIIMEMIDETKRSASVVKN